MAYCFLQNEQKSLKRRRKPHDIAPNTREPWGKRRGEDPVPTPSSGAPGEGIL
jgi:hypothetical protein